MEDLQTDTLSDYVKSQNTESRDLDAKDSENPCTATLLNGCDDIDDPLDLMDHCDNASIGSNSDIWKGSDSEDECFENKDNSGENLEINKNMNTDVQSSPIDTAEDNEEVHSEQEEAVGQGLSKDKNASEKETSDLAENQEKEKTLDNEDSDVPESEKQSAEQTNVKKANKQINEPETQEQCLSPTPRTKTKDLSVDDKEEKAADSNDNQKESNEVDTTKASQNVDEKTAEEVTNIGADDNLQQNSLSNEIADKNSPPNEVNEKDPLADDHVNKETTDVRRPDRNNEGQDDEDSQMDYNDDDDDDFDPSLLCPEVSMAVDENPVITNCGPTPSDENSSPVPYEPVFSTFVDDVTGAEITFNLTAEEQELRKRLYGPTNPVQYSKIHCTACNVHLGSALEGQSNRFVHPLLKVLICKECYHFYTSGEFEKDEDGSELYCRWCGQGGQVLCCSKCEFVFCKRCIRTNFGRKKMFEIRDSDNWDCFRCAPNQIITQRVACFEFFEYVRREMARASTLKSPEIWSKDHSHCCVAKKRPSENGDEVKKPKKKRREMVDPDYTPTLDDKALNAPNLASVLGKAPIFPVNKGIVLPKPVQVVPRFQAGKDNDIEFVRHIPAPQVGGNTVKVNVNTPGYRTILPSTARPVLQPPSVVRINSQSLPPLIPTSNRLLGSALQGQRIVTPPTMMKHEWFEKTVRAAARVNSHLSYTLTQLNKAQSQAASVEELAVVHNKLQEILSSSINSLIQIRKNLRTEFIAGIKTVRLPSKKATETFNNDDDVIFVSAPTTMPMPALTPCSAQTRPSTTTASTSSSSTSSSRDPIIIIDNSTRAPSSNDEQKDDAVKVVSTERPRLKVKSMSELQNVPSECITIPDDTPIAKVDEVAERKDDQSTLRMSEVVCNGTVEKRDSVEKCKTPEPDIIAPTPESNSQKAKPLSTTPTPEGDNQKTKSVNTTPTSEGNSQKMKTVCTTPTPEGNSQNKRPVNSTPTPDDSRQKTESVVDNVLKSKPVSSPTFEKSTNKAELVSEKSSKKTAPISEKSIKKTEPISEKSTKKTEPVSEKTLQKTEIVNVAASEKNGEKTESVRALTPENNSQKTEHPLSKIKLLMDLDGKNILESRTRRSKTGENQISNKTVYNINDEPSGEIKKMLSVTVNLPRVDLEKLQKRLPNGCH